MSWVENKLSSVDSICGMMFYSHRQFYHLHHQFETKKKNKPHLLYGSAYIKSLI